MLRIDLFKEILKSPEKGFIVLHQRPDGDAMGSGLALYSLFKSYGKEMKILSPTVYEKNFDWLPNVHNIQVWKEAAIERLKAEIRKAEIIICVDFSTIRQAGSLGEELLKSNAKKYIIDHHAAPEEWGKKIAWDTEASSTTLLIYRLLKNLDRADHWQDKELISCLYTGLLTDTGLFQHENTTAEAHNMAADLVEKGITPKIIYEKLYQTQTVRKLKFIGHCLLYNLHSLPHLHFSYITVKQKDIQRFALQPGDTRELTYHIMRITGIRIGVVLMDHRDHVRLSFRSTGNIPVNSFAKKYFNGGGHKNAAGGISQKEMTTTVKDLINYIKKELTSFLT